MIILTVDMTAMRLYKFKQQMDDAATVKRLDMMVCLQILKTSCILDRLGAKF